MTWWTWWKIELCLIKELDRHLPRLSVLQFTSNVQLLGTLHRRQRSGEATKFDACKADVYSYGINSCRCSHREVSISAFWISDDSSFVNNLAKGKTTFTWVLPGSSATFDYRSQGSVYTLNKWIIIISQKMNSFSNFEMIYFSIIYYNIVIWVVKLFRVQLMIIMMVSNMSTSYFHKISFHYFEDYLMTKLILV